MHNSNINESCHEIINSATIIDNGEGFNDDNFDNFINNFYESNHKYGKGTGRIAFKKVFSNIKVESYFKEKEEFYYRNFILEDNAIALRNKTNIEKIETKIILNNIKEDFQNATTKSINYYQEEVLKHFYIFFYYLLKKKKTFNISFEDENKKANTVYINNDLIKSDKIYNDSFVLKEFEKEYTFNVSHIKTTNLIENNAFYVVN